MNAAILAFSVICSIFLFPETRFNRVIDPNQRMIAASQSSTTGSREEVKDITSAAGPANPEIMAPMPSQDKFESVDRGHIHTHEDLWLGRGSPSKAQWKLAQPYEGDILKIILTPWKLFAFPIVLFASFVVSWSASATLTVNVTQSLAFGGPPYNFSSGKIGLFNLALLVGAIIGLFTAGPLSDYIAARLTKRQRGIREPEMRLWTIIPYAVIMIIGQLVLAFGYEYKWDWKVCCYLEALHAEVRNSRNAEADPRVGHCDDRLDLLGHPGCCASGYRINICCRFLQICYWLAVHRHHHQQESLELWIHEVHYSLD